MTLNSKYASLPWRLRRAAKAAGWLFGATLLLISPPAQAQTVGNNTAEVAALHTGGGGGGGLGTPTILDTQICTASATCVTDSVDPTNGAEVYVLAVTFGGTPRTCTSAVISDASITFSEDQDVNITNFGGTGDDGSVCTYHGTDASGSGTVTLTLSGTQTILEVYVLEVTGVTTPNAQDNQAEGTPSAGALACDVGTYSSGTVIRLAGSLNDSDGVTWSAATEIAEIIQGSMSSAVSYDQNETSNATGLGETTFNAVHYCLNVQ